MSHAIVITTPGDASVLQWQKVAVPTPKAGEVLIRQMAIGVNFIDIYHRSGLYTLPTYPTAPGIEGVGIVEQAGEGVAEFKSGDRVAYAGGPVGGYAEQRIIPASVLVPVPEGVSDTVAAAALVKGLTAHMLLHKVHALKAGQTILVHAAAGGVGLLLCQWAKKKGARVIGTVGNEAKATLALTHGCNEAIIYTQEDVVARVKEWTKGEGVDVVYDSVGQSTFMASLDCLKPFGLLVSYGQASGPIPLFDIGLLAQKGSLHVTRPTMMHYVRERKVLLAAAKELFALVQMGELEVRIDRTLPLKQAAEAHRLLEGRQTSGSVVLTV